MLTVYKYPIPATLVEEGIDYNETFKLLIPNPGVIIKLGIQPHVSLQFQIWALVDPKEQPIVNKFLLLYTGGKTEETNLLFIDSWISDGIVIHLFKVLK